MLQESFYRGSLIVLSDLAFNRVSVSLRLLPEFIDGYYIIRVSAAVPIGVRQRFCRVSQALPNLSSWSA